MEEPEKLPSFTELDSQIRELKGKLSERKQSRQQGAGVALQVGIELVAGVAVGTGIGYVLDKWLGTSPIFFLLCFFLGAAGGFLTMYRTVAASGQTEEPIDESDNS